VRKTFGAIRPHIVLGALLLSGAALADSYQVVVPMKDLSVADMVASAPKGASTIDCGYLHCYALVDRSIWSVGNNNNGQLGLGDTTRRMTWTQLPEDTFTQGE
jgi:alpha-tubulin suppressor-like RCC1 family protein